MRLKKINKSGCMGQLLLISCTAMIEFAKSSNIFEFCFLKSLSFLLICIFTYSMSIEHAHVILWDLWVKNMNRKIFNNSFMVNLIVL